VAWVDTKDKIIRSGEVGNFQPRGNHNRAGTRAPWPGELPPGVESLVAGDRTDAHWPSVAEFGEYRVNSAGRNAATEFDPTRFCAGAFLDAVNATGPESTGSLVDLVG
jgi:hypothetical protein